MPRPNVKHPERTRATTRTYEARRPIGDTPGVPKAADTSPRAIAERWQPEAYAFTYAVPEVRYVIATKAELLSQCLVRVEQRVPGTDKWEESSDPRAVSVLRALRPEIGSQGDLLAQASVHAEVAGDCWFYGDPVRNDTGRIAGFHWSFLSTSALKVERKGNVVIQSWGKGAFEHKAPPDGHVDHAMFAPDWEYPDRPKSTVFSVLPLMKTLVQCRQLLDAMARRQTNADMFFAPEELSFGPTDEWDDPGTPGNGMDAFEEDLHEYTRQALDQTSPNRLNPFLLTGPGLLKHGDRAWPMKDLLGLIPLAKDFEGYLSAERAELLAAIARGLDIEPEILEGTARVNQWGAYMISEAFITRHVVPMGNRIVTWLTARYLVPMLRTAFRMTDAEASTYRFVLDPSPILVDPDKSKVATIGHEIGVVSDAAWIEYAGLEETDMPDADEMWRRFAAGMVSKYPELGPVLLPVAFPGRNLGDIVTRWPEVTRTGGGSSEGPSVDAPPSRRVGQEPEPNPPSRHSVDSIVRVLSTEADAAVRSVIDRAALRLVGNLSSRDPERAAALRDVPATAVLATAGAGVMRRCGLNVDLLIGDGFDAFEANAADWFSAEVIWPDADDRDRRAAVAAAELVAQLRLVVAGALERPLRPGPNGGLVPDVMIRTALAAADLAAVPA